MPLPSVTPGTPSTSVTPSAAEAPVQHTAMHAPEGLASANMTAAYKGPLTHAAGGVVQKTGPPCVGRATRFPASPNAVTKTAQTAGGQGTHCVNRELPAAPSETLEKGGPSSPIGKPSCKRRKGRPPNISENPLARRLSCIMSVTSGQTSMQAACREYDISARTFYRWMRSKQELIAVTGHGGPAEGAGGEGADRMAGPEADGAVDVTAGRPHGHELGSGDGARRTGLAAGAKKRMPKRCQLRQDGGEGGANGGVQAICTVGEAPADVKEVRGGDCTADSSGGMMLALWPEAGGGRVNGEGKGEGEGDGGIEAGRERKVKSCGCCDCGRGRKHRVVISMGEVKAGICWYADALACDIKAVIRKKFGLTCEDSRWSLVDDFQDEVVISPGMPSGCYTLMLL